MILLAGEVFFSGDSPQSFIKGDENQFRELFLKRLGHSISKTAMACRLLALLSDPIIWWRKP
jgi:hypothetical protein